MKQNHILIVEDEADIREVLQGFFESEGMSVSTASNGIEALQTLKRAPRAPDVILLDLMMPLMNGQEFAMSLRSVQGLAEIPIVIMSADPQTAEKAKSLGLSRFIRKPLDLNRLYELVQGACA